MCIEEDMRRKGLGNDNNNNDDNNISYNNNIYLTRVISVTDNLVVYIMALSKLI